MANRSKQLPRWRRLVLSPAAAPGVIGVLVGAYAHARRRSDALRLIDELMS
jgi:hypothetical protein